MSSRSGSASWLPTTALSMNGRRLGEPLLTLLLRLFVLGVTAAVLAWPLGTMETVLAAGLCGAAAAVLGSLLAASPLRTPVLLLLGAATAGAGVFVRHLLTDTGWSPVTLGARDALRLGDAIAAGAMALGLLGALHAMAVRRRTGAILEVALVATAFASLVAPHRFGAVNRPFEIADPILAAGGDPSVVFLALGGVAAAAVALLLVTERNPLRALAQLVVIALLLGALVWGTRLVGMPPPPPTSSGLGLRSDEDGRRSETHDGKGNDARTGRGSGASNTANEELEFRNEYPRQDQPVPVAVVVLHDDYSPPSGGFYFRQNAFSQFNGQKLVAAHHPGIDEDIAEHFPTRPEEVADPPPGGSLRTPLAQSVALLAEHARPFGVSAPVRFAPAPNPQPARFERVYRVESLALTADLHTLFDRPLGDPRWDETIWRHYTEVPQDPRYRRLAERILEEILPARLREHPMARALAIVQWLGDKGTYSLRSRHANAKDPTADFLFGDLTGYCVHFAHAAVFLMRTLDIPARVATGYAVPDENRRGGSALLITGADAHAWPEVYVRGVGWVPFDVVPNQVLDPPPPPPDEDLQRMLGELLRGEAPLPPEAVDQLPRALDEARRTVVRWGKLSVSLLLLLLLALYLIKLWRRLAPTLAPPEQWPRLVYRAELDRMAEAGLRRRPGESRERFAARLLDQVPTWAALTEIHVGHRFGSRWARDRTAEARQLGRRVREELARCTPWWRRALGWIDPTSWLRAR